VTRQLVQAERGLVFLDSRLLNEIGDDLLLGHVGERLVVVADTRHDVQTCWGRWLRYRDCK